MLTPRTPHAAAGSRGSATFTGRTGVFRRRASAVSAGHGHGGQHLRLALAALVVAVVCVIAWTVSDRLLQPASEAVQPSALSSRTPRREVVDSGRSAAASDYEPQSSDSAAAALPEATARTADDAGGVSLYTCAAGAPGFSWTLTPSGALRNGEGGDCLSFAEGDAALLLTLVPCDSPKVLPFTLQALSGQVRVTLPAGGPDGVFCLDTGDANTQGAPLLLQPCLEAEAVPDALSDSQAWDHAQLPLLASMQFGLCAAAGSGRCGARGFCLSNALGSHMVLQRSPQAAALWGFAPPGDDVTCRLGSTGAEARAVADGSGEWALTLPPQPVGGPHDVVCSSRLRPDAAETLRDVLFGDVFLCGGQSNMVFVTSAIHNGTEEVAAADALPNMRLFSVGQFTARPPAPGVPLLQLGTVEQPWTAASAASVGGSGSYLGFSAVCWVAGRALHAQLGGEVPLGLVVSAWGGTALQQWAPSDAVLRECKQSPGQGARFEAMIAPLLRMRLAGVLFYQGETNVGGADSKTCPGRGPEAYACLFPAVIKGWRAAFAAPDLFFAFVQLSPYTPYACGRPAARLALPRLRDAQLAGLAVEHTAVVTAIDLGDADSPYRDVHPRPKAPIGERLAAALAAQLYGIAGVAHRSPMLESAALTTAGVTVTFQAATCGGGLVSRPEPECPATLEAGMCAGWELQAADGVWVAASAAVTGRESVTVTAPGLAGAPLGVRYAYAPFPLVSLFSGDGLPALPLSAQLGV